MSDETSQHFLHRKSNGLVTRSKTSLFRKFSDSIMTPERCFKNRCWSGKEQSPLTTRTSINQICIAQCMSAHAMQIPTEQSRGDGQ